MRTFSRPPRRPEHATERPAPMFTCWCGAPLSPTRKQFYDAMYADEPPMITCANGHDTPLKRGKPA